MYVNPITWLTRTAPRSNVRGVVEKFAPAALNCSGECVPYITMAEYIVSTRTHTHKKCTTERTTVAVAAADGRAEVEAFLLLLPSPYHFPVITWTYFCAMKVMGARLHASHHYDVCVCVL